MPVVLYECVPGINSFAPPPAKITEFGVSFGTWGLGFGSSYTYGCVTIAPRLQKFISPDSQSRCPIDRRQLGPASILCVPSSTTDTSSDAPFAV
jgi:hypothetical protein